MKVDSWLKIKSKPFKAREQTLSYTRRAFAFAPFDFAFRDEVDMSS